MKRTYIKAIIAGLLLLVGTVALTYPFASQWVTQYQQMQANQKMLDSVKTIDSTHLDKIIESAEEYNEQLFSRRLGVGDPRYMKEMLVPGSDIMGRLQVPSIDIDQPIRHTLIEEVLITGTGHTEGTSLPIGGPNTHTVLGGHRGLAQSVGFTNLPRVKVGDRIYVEALGRVMVYEIFETVIVSPQEAEYNPIEKDRDLLTLITCTPLGVNSHRFLAKAERVDIEEAVDFDETAEMPFPWWIILLIAGLTISIWAPRNIVKKEKKFQEARRLKKLGIDPSALKNYPRHQLSKAKHKRKV